MNILFVVPYAPNLIRTRPYNLIRGLRQRGNLVTLVTLWENSKELESLRQLTQEGIKVVYARLTKARSAWNAFQALPSSIPIQAVYCWQPSLLRLLDSEIQNQHFDVIHVEHLRGARYGLWLKSRFTQSNARPAVIWDSVDCISYLFDQAAQSSASLFGRFVTRLELARTRHYEGWAVKQFDQVLVTSPIDKNALERLAANHNSRQESTRVDTSSIQVLPNGVDLDFFSPTNYSGEPDTLVFSGKMSYHANVTAASYLVNDIMPLVWSKRPSVRVLIVGKDPSLAIRELATRNPERVIVTGTVSDIRPSLARAAIAVSPVKYGAGIQNKVLEAMAMAIPVVATAQAVSALQVQAGEHLLVAASPEAFAQTVLNALANPELQHRIGQAGRRYVEQHHNWKDISGQLEEVYTLATKLEN